MAKMKVMTAQNTINARKLYLFANDSGTYDNAARSPRMSLLLNVL